MDVKKEIHMDMHFYNVRSQEKGSGETQASSLSSDAPKRNHFYDFHSRGEQEDSTDVFTDML